MSATPYGILPRPEFVITQEVLDTIEEAAARGLNGQQIAGVLGVTYKTILEKRKKYSSIQEHIDKGHARFAQTIVNAAFVNATTPAIDSKGNPVGPPAGNIDMQKFLMKTRLGYKENDAAVSVNFVIPPLFAQPEPAFKSLLQGELTNDEVTE